MVLYHQMPDWLAGGDHASVSVMGNAHQHTGHRKVQRNLSIGHLSNEDTVCSPNHRAVYKSTSELGTPLYTGQPAMSQWYSL